MLHAISNINLYSRYIQGVNKNKTREIKEENNSFVRPFVGKFNFHPIHFCGNFNVTKSYVTGHKNPDTDSVVSAIAYSYLLAQLGEEYTPVACKRLNSETQYVLERFGVEQPEIVDDFVAQVKDVMHPYDGKNLLDEDSTISQLGKLIQKGYRSLAVLDSKSKKVIGMVTDKDVAKLYFSTPEDMHYPYKFDAISKTLDANVIAGRENLSNEHNGQIVFADSDLNTVLDSINEGDLLVVGDREDVQEAAIVKGISCLILSQGHCPSSKAMELANEKGTVVMITHHDARAIGKYIEHAINIKNVMSKSPKAISENMPLAEIVKDIDEYPYRAYPVLDKKAKFVGIAKKTDLLKGVKRNFILVDHNTTKQSPDGINPNEIRGIIDHHLQADLTNRQDRIDVKIGKPGSTSTMITSEFITNEVEIPQNIAGILLCGILSDTDILTSATTRQIDIKMANKLAKIAGVEDINQLGEDLMKVRTSEAYSATSHEALVNDIKDFSNDKKEMMCISQISVDNPEKFLALHPDMVNAMNEYDQKYGAKGTMLVVTCNGGEKYSRILVSDRLKQSLDSASVKIPYKTLNSKCTLGTKLGEAINRIRQAQAGLISAKFEDVMSRKEQVQPFIMQILNS